LLLGSVLQVQINTNRIGTGTGPINADAVTLILVICSLPIETCSTVDICLVAFFPNRDMLLTRDTPTGLYLCGSIVVIVSAYI
jgi:hypothetical protein